NGTDSRRYMGPLPPLGRWVRLAVPAWDVGLGITPSGAIGHSVRGMSFLLVDGRAAWACEGKGVLGSSPASDTIWFGGAVPAGATPGGDGEGWSFVAGDELRAPLEEEFETEIVNGKRVSSSIKKLKEELA